MFSGGEESKDDKTHYPVSPSSKEEPQVFVPAPPPKQNVWEMRKSNQVYSPAWLSYFPKQQMLDLPKLKEFVDDKFKFDENGGKYSETVENTVGKGENVHYKEFLLFPQCFEKTSAADTLKPGLVWERVNLVNSLCPQWGLWLLSLLFSWLCVRPLFS